MTTSLSILLLLLCPLFVAIFIVLCCLTWKNFEFWIISYIHLNLPKSTAKLKTKINYAWRCHLSPVYTGLNIVYRLRGHESSLIIIPEMLRQSRTFEGVSHWKALKSYISIVSHWRNRLKNSRFLQNDVMRGISQISKRRLHVVKVSCKTIQNWSRYLGLCVPVADHGSRPCKISHKLALQRAEVV